MPKRVSASDVLTPNAVTAFELRGQEIGRYKPSGPNKWDDYELHRQVRGEVTIKREEKIQVEPLGLDPEIRFRIRRRGAVVVVRWLPNDEDRQALESGRWGIRESEQATTLEKIFGMGPRDDPRDDLLEYFLDVKTDPFEADKGLGALAVLVQKLKASRHG